MTPPPAVHTLRSLTAVHPDPVGFTTVAWSDMHDLARYIVWLEAEAEREGAAHGERG